MAPEEKPINTLLWIISEALKEIQQVPKSSSIDKYSQKFKKNYVKILFWYLFFQNLNSTLLCFFM
jgi:hypothetical protein